MGRGCNDINQGIPAAPTQIGVFYFFFDQGIDFLIECVGRRRSRCGGTEMERYVAAADEGVPGAFPVAIKALQAFSLLKKQCFKSNNGAEEKTRRMFPLHSRF